MSKQFLKEVQKAIKYMKKCSTSSAIKEMYKTEIPSLLSLNGNHQEKQQARHWWSMPAILAT
jgi:hypothetical protein